MTIRTFPYIRLNIARLFYGLPTGSETRQAGGRFRITSAAAKNAGALVSLSARKDTPGTMAGGFYEKKGGHAY